VIVHITLLFHQHLRPLLPPSCRQEGRVARKVSAGTSIKDAVEALRVPHTEVGQLQADGRQVDFSYQVQEGNFIEVLPLVPPVTPCTPSLLRPEPLPTLKFMVDVNVARLAALLRMAGINTSCRPDLRDADIAAVAVREERILLSRDRGLLKRKIIAHGHLVRSQRPEEQLTEVVDLYGLRDLLQPFSRCMQCNTPLCTVKKSTIIDRLEPLTRKYYQTFYLCPACDKIYWSGSHKKRMNQLLRTLDGPNHSAPGESTLKEL